MTDNVDPAKLDFLPSQLTPAAKRTIIVGMCEGLLHLHYKDVVHQDLKPENVMVRNEHIPELVLRL